MKNFELLIYNTPTEDVKVNVVLKDETIWATQKAMSILYGCSTDNIGLHLKNIFGSGELPADSTTEIFSVVQIEGDRQVRRNTRFYNLDAIISVGYRVSSARATQFRIWATSVLKEYIKKGFVLNDERMKNGGAIFGKDYFRELLERAVSGYFDYIEDLIERENTFTMEQFAASVNEFLAFRRYEILPDRSKGLISHEQAKKKAESEYEEFNKTQQIVSDFDREIHRFLGDREYQN